MAKILGKVAVAAALATTLAASGPAFATLITDTTPGSAAVTSDNSVASNAVTTAANAFSLLSGHESFGVGAVGSNLSAQSRVPEPTTLALLGLGLAGLGFIRRRK